ncbi:hypothetical protein MLD52_07110 [Puniceicoccaceae bacterium K14]|nr:hypothetical protein [Puniceicoccaceae bacterium K14]
MKSASSPSPFSPRFLQNKKAFSLLFPILVLCFLTGCGSSDTKPNGMGLLTDFLFKGTVEGWSGSTVDGIYWLENQAGNPNDIRYFYTAANESALGKRTAEVEVFTEHMDPDSRAGLLYGFQESTRSYYLIVAGSNGSIDMYRKDGDGFQLSQSSSIDAKPNESIHIKIEEDGQQLTILANGKTLSSIGNNSIGKGNLGVAAFGSGKFGFTNYQETPSSESVHRTIIEPENRKVAAQPTKIRQSNYIDYVDPKNGMVKFSAPFPKGWLYDKNPNDQLYLTGPNGTKVYQTSSPQFVYSDDPFARQSAQQMGGAQLAPLVPLDRFLQQQFSPYMQQRGFKLVKSYPLQEMVDVLEVFAAGMPQGLSRKQFDAMGAEWENTDGSQAFTLLTQTILLKEQFINWSVGAGELYASNSEYEKAKNDFIYGSVNTDFNPKWQIQANKELLANIMRDTQMWDERMRQSHIQHVGRMNAILARSESSSSIAKINSDILDISHAGYLKRDNMVSSGQANTVNSIGEYSVISNPNTGELYKVDAGSNNHWVNSQGVHFQTDNSNYDPRTDISISDQQWERFDVVN